jgi:hypothetical protein
MSLKEDLEPRTRCGYCQRDIRRSDAAAHWDRGFVSRCRLRAEAEWQRFSKRAA